MQVRISSYNIELRNSSYKTQTMILNLISALLLVFGARGQEHQKSISPAAQHILGGFIQMHEDPSIKNIESFIDNYYRSQLLTQMSSKENHIKFYQQIIDEFGELNKDYLQVDIAEKGHYRLQLIKKGLALVPKPSDLDILVIDIEVDEKTQKLTNSLGLGALVCYDKR